jgi:RNA polymerase sigma-70 factor (ECF subfamily)
MITQLELDIIEGCIRNDRKSQKNLYNKYCNAMYTITYRILNDKDNANDALQDAFIQVFKDIDKFRKESTLGAWIKTIVIRTALRKLKSERFTEQLDENEHDIAITIPNSLTGEYLEKAILSLSSGYRTVFLLVEVEGYSHKEVANELNISEGTSKSQLFHAKRLLKEKLESLELVN